MISLGRFASLAAGVLLFVFCPGSISASPDSHTWRREILLGANGQDHFYLLYQLSNPGSYYIHTESLFVCQRSDRDPARIQKQLLRVLVYSRFRGEASVEERWSIPFDLVEYLREHDVRPAFRASWPESVAVDERGMYYHEHGLQAHFLGRKEVDAWVPHLESWLIQDKGSVVGLMQTTAPWEKEGGPILYYLVRSGHGLSDADHLDGFVPVPETKVRDAIEEVNDRLRPGSARGR